MKNLSAILSRLNGSLWFMTEDSLKVLLEIVETRVNGGTRSDEEIRALLQAAQMNSDRQHSGRENLRGIGILPLYGPIFPKANMMTEMSGATSLEQFKSDFRAMMGDDFVGTIVMDIDSPGGHADGIREMAREIREGRDKKDIVAVANYAANSAAYYLGSQATKMYSSDSGQVGSVGVYTVHRDETRKDEMEGVKHTVISAGGNKAEHLEPLSADARAHLQSHVDEKYDEFVEDVALGRDTTEDNVRANYGGGRVFTASKALSVGMIDGIASLDKVLGRLIESGGDISAIDSAPVPVMAHVHVGTRTVGSSNTRMSYDADKEHSEPGTGQGGEPTPREPPETGDKAIAGGWRRDTPPIVNELEDEEMNRQWLEARATALGIEFSADTSDEDLAQSVATRVDEVIVPINTAAASAERAREWEKDYPEQAAKLAALENKDRINEARTFAESYASFEDEPNKGFSTLVRDKLESAHLKLTDRSLGVEEFKELVDSMCAKDSVVTFGEQGSARVRETTAVAAGASRNEVRSAFAELVSAAMTEDGLDRKAAIAHVSEQNPELAKAYAES